MTETAAHHKQMENLMAAEICRQLIKYRQLQSVKDAADGVNDASCEKPAKTGTWKRMKNWNKGKDTQPSHTDIKHGREPFRAGDPESLKKDTKDRNAPYKSTEDVTNTIMQSLLLIR